MKLVGATNWRIRLPVPDRGARRDPDRRGAGDRLPVRAEGRLRRSAPRQRRVRCRVIDTATWSRIIPWLLVAARSSWPWSPASRDATLPRRLGCGHEPARDPEGEKSVATNRRARHDYDILETFEAGIVLTGPEVKCLRAGQASLSESYARVSERRGVARGYAHPSLRAGVAKSHVEERPAPQAPAPPTRDRAPDRQDRRERGSRWCRCGCTSPTGSPRSSWASGRGKRHREAPGDRRTRAQARDRARGRPPPLRPAVAGSPYTRRTTAYGGVLASI